MRQFEEPVITAIVFQVTDIITTSELDGDGYGPIIKI